MRAIRHRLLRALVSLPTVVFLAASPSSAIGNEGADGRFERRESLHFTLYQDVDLDEHSGLHGSRSFEQSVLRALESAYDLLSRSLDLRPDRKLDVTVWDPALFDARFAGLFRFPAAGFYGGSIQIRGDVGMSPGLIRVLHHELVHAALDSAAPDFLIPAWLNEGLAEWFEARSIGKRSLAAGERAALERVARSGRLAFLAELSRPSFGGLAPDAAAFAYLESYAFIDFLARRGGDAGLAELCADVLHSRNVERGVRLAYRRELEQLERSFRQELGVH